MDKPMFRVHMKAVYNGKQYWADVYNVEKYVENNRKNTNIEITGVELLPLPSEDY